MVASAISEAHSEIDYWRAAGVAVLPGAPGTKGPWPHGWPDLPHAETWEQADDQASRRRVNLAVRLGLTAGGDRIVGHVDFDAIDGVDAGEALERARLLFPGALDCPGFDGDSAAWE